MPAALHSRLGLFTSVKSPICQLRLSDCISLLMLEVEEGPIINAACQPCKQQGLAKGLISLFCSDAHLCRLRRSCFTGAGSPCGSLERYIRAQTIFDTGLPHGVWTCPRRPPPSDHGPVLVFLLFCECEHPLEPPCTPSHQPFWSGLFFC